MTINALTRVKLNSGETVTYAMIRLCIYFVTIQKAIA